MQLYQNNGILLSAGEIEALLQCAGKDAKDEKTRGAMLKARKNELVACATNGAIGLIGTITMRHSVPLGEWFLPLHDLQRIKAAVKGGFGAFLVNDRGTIEVCEVLDENKETQSLTPAGEWKVTDPAQQLPLFPAASIEEATRTPIGSPRASFGCSSDLLGRFRFLGKASESGYLELLTPTGDRDPIVAVSTHEDGTEWRGCLMPQANPADQKKPKAEDPKKFKLEPTERGAGGEDEGEGDGELPEITHFDPAAESPAVREAVDRFMASGAGTDTTVTVSVMENGKETQVATITPEMADAAAERVSDRRKPRNTAKPLGSTRKSGGGA